MKKFLKTVLLTLIACFLIISANTFAENRSDVVVALQINNPIMQVNGIETEIDAGHSTSPLISQGRTLVPIRAIIEAFGGNVTWDANERAVLLTLENDTIKLIIDSSTAYINYKAQTLDTAPVIINNRTMLPIRFIAEGFNLGVAWDNTTQTVTVITNGFDENEYNQLVGSLPPYSGSAYTVINDNIPMFKPYEIIGASFEFYSNLDSLGRCDVCMASVAEDIMPVEERKSISEVTPTGWKNASYDIVEGRYLYNRCHLIGFQLTGENANERNLITGTRYLNIEGMLPFENMVDNYIEQTGNHVIYRATPVFKDDNLVAHGVLLEAYSVEDEGTGISFCVYCYNTQPGISIDYETGENHSLSAAENGADVFFRDADILTDKIYRTPTGKRYHFDPDCGGKNSFEVTLTEATAAGLTPCAKCAQ